MELEPEGPGYIQVTRCELPELPPEEGFVAQSLVITH